jgi:hypothetical protein
VKCVPWGKNMMMIEELVRGRWQVSLLLMKMHLERIAPS